MICVSAATYNRFVLVTSFFNAAMLSNHIMCVSNAVRDDLLTFTKAKKKTGVVYNGLPDIDFKTPAKADNKTRILFAANITPHKGAHILIEAACILKKKNIHVDIAGWVQDKKYETYLQELIKKRGVEGVVTLHGFVENIDELYASADIVACPTVESGELHGKQIWWKEGFNLSALEAMRAKKPVICSATYGLKEVVEDGVTGTHVNQNDAYELARAIERFIESPDRAKRMGRAGRTRYETYFTEEHMRKNFEEALELF